MLKLQGTPINPGIVEGPTFIKMNPIHILSGKTCNLIDPNTEVQKYWEAIDTLHSEFQALKYNNNELSNKTNQQMIDLYLAILNDPVFKKRIPLLIAEQKVSVDCIIIQELETIQKEFAKINNEYFRSRFDDFQSIGYKILEKIMGIGDYENITKPKIIVAETLSAVDLLHIPLEYIIGIITAFGGSTSHAAILAEALEIPAIFGVKDIIDYVHKKDIVIMDGYTGDIVVNPTPETSTFYKTLSQRHLHYEQEVLSSVSGNQTKDGHSFSILANIGNAYDLPLIYKYNGDGIGLLRTETLVLLEEALLGEEEQSAYYHDILVQTAQMPVYIRTLDLGGDKTIRDEAITPLDEDNPFLGFRSTRLFVQDPREFQKQIRAILKNHHINPNIKIIIPFITTLDDFLILKSIILECYTELYNAPCPIPIGMMVEVPSALICIEDYLPHTDFISIGTNDLTQYILATDRNNLHVSHYHTPAHPAIIRMLALAGQSCNNHGVPLSLCGEMGREPHFIRLLYGLGIHTLSMSPLGIPMARYILTHSTVQECKKIVADVLKMQYARYIEEYLQQDLINFLKQQDAYFDNNFLISNQTPSESL
ncbi:MAG: phosphoenolpyruvate--protein phosphotransferase [Brevinema sp.]